MANWKRLIADARTIVVGIFARIPRAEIRLSGSFRRAGRGITLSHNCHGITPRPVATWREIPARQIIKYRATIIKYQSCRSIAELLATQHPHPEKISLFCSRCALIHAHRRRITRHRQLRTGGTWSNAR